VDIIALINFPLSLFLPRRTRRHPVHSLIQSRKNPTLLPSSPFSGTVVETMNAGDYTYVLLEKSGKRHGSPCRRARLRQTEITLRPGIEMKNFRSKSLNRTFEKIIFSGGLVSQAGSASGDVKVQSPHGGKTTGPRSRLNGSVLKKHPSGRIYGR